MLTAIMAACWDGGLMKSEVWPSGGAAAGVVSRFAELIAVLYTENVADIGDRNAIAYLTSSSKKASQHHGNSGAWIYECRNWKASVMFFSQLNVALLAQRSRVKDLQDAANIHGHCLSMSTSHSRPG